MESWHEKKRRIGDYLSLCQSRSAAWVTVASRSMQPAHRMQVNNCVSHSPPGPGRQPDPACSRRQVRAADTARLLESGRSQAVIVQHLDNGLLLLPIVDPWQNLQAPLITNKRSEFARAPGLPLDNYAEHA